MTEKQSDQKTLRDEFAMAAMAALLADIIKHQRDGVGEIVAKQAYKMADAMLKERNDP